MLKVSCIYFLMLQVSCISFPSTALSGHLTRLGLVLHPGHFLPQLVLRTDVTIIFDSKKSMRSCKLMGEPSEIALHDSNLYIARYWCCTTSPSTLFAPACSSLFDRV